MAKVKYRYNPKSLTYEKVQKTAKSLIMRTLGYLFTGLAFSAVIIFIAYAFFDSPKERMLQREIEQYKLQFEILNDRLDQVANVLVDMQERDDNIYRVIFESEPIPWSIRNAGFGGSDRYARLDGYINSDIIIQTTRRLDQMTSQTVVQSKSFDEVFRMAKNKAEMLACIPAIQPIRKGDGRIVSGYGMRYHPILKYRRMHHGIDISAPSGTPIYATGDGTVKSVGRHGGYGNAVIIDHGYGYQTLYGHMKTIIVRKNKKVKRGEIIGYVGNTGLSRAPHVHYEVIYNNKKIDPVNYFYNDFTPEEFEKVRELASKDNQVLS
jgi:murein DD-endopeptidase MepM/ murein hydrolase activator NlpD